MVNIERKIISSEKVGGAASIPKGQRRVVNKARRVDALLEAAHGLIEETAGTDFTMQQLASRAGFSLATTYNLIGTKAAVLHALLDRSLDGLDVLRGGAKNLFDGKRVLTMVEIATDFFGCKPAFYRPLMRYLLGAYEPVLRPRFMSRALSFWSFATSGIGGIDERTDSNQLAWHLHLAFTGILDLWVHEELGADEFRQAMISHARMLMEKAAPGLSTIEDAR